MTSPTASRTPASRRQSSSAPPTNRVSPPASSGCCGRSRRRTAQTGVPISTHTHAATRRGLEQQRIFTEEGVDLSRVVIGHCGDTTDIGYLEELIGNGSYIGMDRFGLDIVPVDRGTGEHRGDDVRARARRQDGVVARRLVLARLAAGGARAGRHAELALPAHPQRRAARIEGARRDRRTDHHHAGGQPAQDLLRTRAATDMADQTPTYRHPGVAAGRAGSRRARGHLLGPHTHPPGTRPVDEQAGACLRRARRRRRRLRDDRAAQLDRVGAGRARRMEARRNADSRCRRGCPTPSSRRCLRCGRRH